MQLLHEQHLVRNFFLKLRITVEGPKSHLRPPSVALVRTKNKKIKPLFYSSFITKFYNKEISLLDYH